MEEQKKSTEQVQTEKVKVSIEGAVSGSRERGWTIQNKCRQIAQLKDKVKFPVVSLYETDPSKVPTKAWQLIKTPDEKNLLCCQKTILLLSEVVMQPEMDASDQVVLRMHVLAPKEESIDKNLFWKQTWGRFMHLGGISWEELLKEGLKRKEQEKSTKTPDLQKLKDLSLKENTTSTKK